jgi:hypothetical protein
MMVAWLCHSAALSPFLQKLPGTISLSNAISLVVERRVRQRPAGHK